MSAGMKVQCSILESSPKGLKESPVKVLQGNQLPPVVEVRTALCGKKIGGFLELQYEPYNGVAVVPLFTGGAFLQSSRRFYRHRQDDFIVNSPTGSYSMSASVGAFNVPTMTRNDGSTMISGDYNSFALSGAGFPGTFWFITSYDPTFFTVQTPPGSGSVSGESRQTTLIDTRSIYLSAAGSFLAKLFEDSWATPVFGLGFNDWNGGTENIDVALVPPGLDGSQNTNYLNAGVTPVPGAHGSSGWSNLGGQINSIWRSKLRVTPTIPPPQNYWIGRFEQGAGMSPTFTGILFKTRVSYITDGILEPGEMLGLGLPSSLPFPAMTTPYDEVFIVPDFLRVSDIYFAVIGKDFSQWSAETGLTLGINNQ